MRIFPSLGLPSLCALALAGTVALATFAGVPGGAVAQSLTPEQQKHVEDIVKRIIKEQPKLILDALQDMRKQEEAEAQSKALQAVKTKRDEIVKDPTAPVAGNPDGDVAVVQFFDYRCPYCKSVAEKVIQTVKKDGKVKLVFKELPILGPESVFASRAALAVHRQGKYVEFHIALMQAKERLTDAITMRIAGGLGLDMEKLKKDMASPEIGRILDANSDLAEELNIRGTPAFIIGDQLVPGAVDTENLEKMIAQARKK